MCIFAPENGTKQNQSLGTMPGQIGGRVRDM